MVAFNAKKIVQSNALKLVILLYSMKESIGIRINKANRLYSWKRRSDKTTIPKMIPVIILCFKTD